jgi:hypothetical protein
MKLHIIRSPLAPLNKGGTGKTSIKVPLYKGDLGGSRYVQLHIKLVLSAIAIPKKNLTLTLEVLIFRKTSSWVTTSLLAF